MEVDESKFDEPLKPQLASKGKYCFTIKVNYTEFPELQVFENTLFQLTDSINIDPELTNTLWHDVKIEKGNKKGVYNISFTCYEKKAEYEVTPVYDKNDINKAIEIFEKKFESYKTILLAGIENKIKIKEEKELKEIKEINILVEKYKKENDEQKKEEIQNEINMIKMDSIVRGIRKQNQTNEVLYRTFSIKQFGTYNCDCPSKMPKGDPFIASFVDPKGNPIKFDHVTLTQLSKNLFYNYYSNGFNDFKFDPNDKNMLCAITADGKLTYFTANDFKGVNISGEYTFKMRISPKEINNSDDIEEILALK